MLVGLRLIPAQVRRRVVEPSSPQPPADRPAERKMNHGLFQAGRGDPPGHRQMEEIAVEECNDIEAWRDAAQERNQYTGDPKREWPDPPRDFWSDTAMVAAWLTSNYPHFDPKPLFDICAFVAAWHADHNASRIPLQPLLVATLERAMHTVSAVAFGIQNRYFYLPGNVGNPEAHTGSPSVVSANDDRDKWIYGQATKGRTWASIMRALNKKPATWERIGTENGIKDAAKRYAKRHNLPAP